jgi:ribose transport system substrate-binding protein
MPNRDRGSYTIEAVAKACKVLQAFRDERDTLRLRDLVARTGLNKTSVFRILCTMEAEGLVDVLGPDRYRVTVRAINRQKFKLGFAKSVENSLFTEDVAEGLRRMAAEERCDLLELNNRYSAKIAIRNAEIMIQSHVDLAIEYQYHEEVAQTISSMFHEAGIPMVAITVPHPNAVFFGPDGYEAGRTGGRALGQWAKQNWNSAVDEVLLLKIPLGGNVLNSRLTGVAMGIKEILTGLTDSQIVRLDGRGEFSASLEAVRKHLRLSRSRRVLISSPFEASVLGALRAFEEAGRALDCVAVGQGGTLDARTELRRPNTRMIGTVAFFPERYGERLIRIALDILNHRPVPPAIFVRHCLLTPRNVDQYYPNDMLLGMEDFETFLLRSA